VCNQGLGVFWGVNPGFTHFGGFKGYWGFGSFSLNASCNYTENPAQNHHQPKRYHHHTIYISIQGGGYIGGIGGFRGV
jgi:hypothetical protein